MRKSFSNSLAIGLVLIAVTVLYMPFLSDEANAQNAPDVYYNTFEFSDMRSTFQWAGNYWADQVRWHWAPERNRTSHRASILAPAILGFSQSYPPVYVNEVAFAARNGVCGTKISFDWCWKHALLPYNRKQAAQPNDGAFVLSCVSKILCRLSVRLRQAELYERLRWHHCYREKRLLAGLYKYQSCHRGRNSSANYDCNQGHSCTMTGDGQWHSLEVELDPNGGGSNAATIRMWRDDVLVMEYCQSCSAHATISTPFNPGGIGFGEYDNASTEAGGSPTQNQSFWLDDLAVSRQRIGPVSGTVISPPSSPTSLTLR